MPSSPEDVPELCVRAGRRRPRRRGAGARGCRASWRVRSAALDTASVQFGIWWSGRLIVGVRTMGRTRRADPREYLDEHAMDAHACNDRARPAVWVSLRRLVPRKHVCTHDGGIHSPLRFPGSSLEGSLITTMANTLRC